MNPRPHDINQLPLGSDILAEPTTAAAQKRAADRDRIIKTTRPRTYDDSALGWIAYHGRVTRRQFIYRYFLFAGKKPRYGYRLIQRLVNDGRVGFHPLDRTLGNTSQDVLHLTAYGYESIDLPRPKTVGSILPEAGLNYLLQFAEMALERQLEGWRIIPPTRRDEQVAAIVEWLLVPHQDHAKDIADIRVLDNIESLTRNEEINFKIDLIVNENPPDVRFVIPVRPGDSYAEVLKGMPSMIQLDYIPIEVVCSEQGLWPVAEKHLKRWGKKRRRPVQLHRVAHFTERPPPPKYPGTRVNWYGSIGIKDAIGLPDFILSPP